MTRRLTIKTETVTFLLIAVILASLVVFKNTQSYQNTLHVVSPIIADNATQTIITPVLNPILPVETASQISPDGTKILTLKTTHNPNGTQTFAFTTSNTTDNIQQALYVTSLNSSESISIPFNTWSPDDRYVFLQKNGNNALVFNANGKSFSADQPYLDIANAFTTKGIKNFPVVTTGWASPTLLIVNTTTQEGTKGPSYWFEVPTKAIIQLAGQF